MVSHIMQDYLISGVAPPRLGNGGLRGVYAQEKWGGGSSRLRRIGIVALARKLLVELWRYLQTGALPEGAVTKV